MSSILVFLIILNEVISTSRDRLHQHGTQPQLWVHLWHFSEHFVNLISMNDIMVTTCIVFSKCEGEGSFVMIPQGETRVKFWHDCDVWCVLKAWHSKHSLWILNINSIITFIDSKNDHQYWRNYKKVLKGM